MIDGNILVLLKGDAIETVCQTEDAVNHFRQFEIGSQHLGIYIL